jgi:chemotaxis protein MotB
MSSKLKRHLHEEIDSEGSWALSYGDMITLLLSFFVIYFSTDFNKPQEKKMQEQLFKDLVAESPLLLTNIETEKIESNLEVVKLGPDKLAMFFKGESFFDRAEVSMKKDKEIILSKVSDKLLPYLGKYKIKVQAFTDDRPVRGENPRFKDNIELSALRAVDVMRKLNKFGIPLHRMEISGKGILSDSILAKLGQANIDKQQKRDLSRTIGLLLYREDD